MTHDLIALTIVSGLVYFIQLVFWYVNLVIEGEYDTRKEALTNLIPAYPIITRIIKAWNELD